MKSAVAAFDPTVLKGKPFERMCDLIHHFQNKGLFLDLKLASLIHSSLYPYPIRIYNDEKDKFAKEAKDLLIEKCQGHFRFSSAHTLVCDSSGSEEQVRKLAKFAARSGAELIITGSNDRTGLPYWFLGSFSETAALTSPVPVLIIKPQITVDSLAKRPHITVAVDVTQPPNKQVLRQIANIAGPIGAEVRLIYVKSEPRVAFKAPPASAKSENAYQVLEKIKKSLQSFGVQAKVKILQERDSIAHTVAEYATKHSSWFVVATTAERSTLRKLLLGSNARQILALAKSPFLALRAN